MILWYLAGFGIASAWAPLATRPADLTRLAVGEELTVVLSTREPGAMSAERAQSLLSVDADFRPETLLRRNRNFVRVQISGEHDDHSLSEAASIAVSEVGDGVLVWRHAWALAGRYHLSFVLDHGNCSRSVWGRTNASDLCVNLAGRDHHFGELRVAVVTAGAARAPRAPCSAAELRWRVVAADLSDGWWRSARDAIENSSDLRWELAACDGFESALKQAFDRAMARWTAGSCECRRIVAIGDSNTQRLVNGALKKMLAPAGVGLAFTPVYHNDNEYAKRWGVIDSALGDNRVAVILGPDAHNSTKTVAVDRTEFVAHISRVARRVPAAVQWGSFDQDPAIIPERYVGQRLDRSSWRIAAKNAVEREVVEAEGIRYVDAFGLTLPLHPWRQDTVHLNNPHFAEAVVRRLLPMLVFVELERSCARALDAAPSNRTEPTSPTRRATGASRATPGPKKKACRG